VDSNTGALAITKSRHLGGEHIPKTGKSEGTITVVEGVRQVLRDLKPLRADADDYVFVNPRNRTPINQSEWSKDHWRAALRATDTRRRKFYATRHTFISVALTAGVNIQRLGEYCGPRSQ